MDVSTCKFPFRKACYFILLLLLGAGCDVDLTPPKETPQVLFVALDGTGSYDHLRQAKKRAIQALEDAPPGSRVYVRWITSSSAAPTAAIASEYIPPEADNPFNPNSEKQSAKKRLARGIADAESPQANTTDLKGLLWSAGQRFKKHPDLKRTLILATDLDGNAKQNVPEMDLSHASIRVIGFEVDPSHPRRETKWKQLFQRAGADTTIIRYSDQLAATPTNRR